MPELRLKRIRTMTFAYWISFISAVFGIFFGLLFGFMSYASFGLQYGLNYIFRWIVATPIVFGLIGFLASLGTAIMYNLFVRKRGVCFSNSKRFYPNPNFRQHLLNFEQISIA
jgi:hypothetical protein